MRLEIRKKSEEIHLFSLFPPEVTNIRSSNVKFPRVRHAAISRTTIFPWSFHFCQQDSYARSHNYFQQLSILSTRKEKFTPIQFISRSSNKEPRRCIALYLENVFIVGYVGKKKKKTRKSNRCRVATAPRSVSGCILSPRREQYNILSRGNREAKTKHNFVKLRTHGSDVYARCIYRSASSCCGSHNAVSP